MPRIVLMLCLMVGLTACEEQYSDAISEACLRDGQPLKYCACTAQGMQLELGPNNYAIFADIISLTGDEAPKTNEIIEIMERHGLAPELLANVMQSIEKAANRVHAACSP